MAKLVQYKMIRIESQIEEAEVEAVEVVEVEAGEVEDCHRRCGLVM
jgi:hypothetical protein